MITTKETRDALVKDWKDRMKRYDSIKRKKYNIMQNPQDLRKIPCFWDEGYLEELKGGKENMETKSRYEVIAELEGKKRTLIREREGLKDVLNEKEVELKFLKREVEDKEEDIKTFKESMENTKKTITELIGSVDDSLKRFEKLNTKK